MGEERTTWWFWIPALPKPLIVAAWAVFWSLTISAPFIRELGAPQQPWWLDIWQGIGGNAIGVFTWAVIATQLTSEVVYMIFTFRANKKQVEDAALKSREKGREEGREEGASLRDVIWQEWVDQIKDKPQEEWPPPPGSDNGASNGDVDYGKS